MKAPGATGSVMMGWRAGHVETVRKRKKAGRGNPVGFVAS